MDDKSLRVQALTVDDYTQWFKNAPMVDKAALAKRVRLRMVELGIPTQQILATRARLALGTVQRILRGEHGSRQDNYEKLAVALEWTLAELLEGPSEIIAQPTQPDRERLNAESYEMGLRYQHATTDIRIQVRRLLTRPPRRLRADVQAAVDALYEPPKPDRRQLSKTRKKPKFA